MHVGLVVSDDLDYGLDLANALIEAGMSVTLYLSLKHTSLYMWGAERNETAALQPDILIDRLYKLGLVPRSCQVRLTNFPRIRDPRSLITIYKLSREIAKDGLDVVHILMGPGEFWIAILGCIIHRLPITSTLIIPEPNVGEDLPVFMLWAIAKILTLGSDLVIVNGAKQVDLVCRLYAVNPQKVVHIPLVPRFAAAKWAICQHQEIPGSVLFIGKAQPRKGLEFLVKAQPIINSRIPNAKIVLATHGDDLDRCLALITDESKFEIHNGFLTAAELAEYFQKASLVALPYISASTSGLLTTAYVFGKPVVSTTVGALPEYVQDEITGLLVPPADETRLAEAIIRILSDDDLRHKMGKNAKEWVDSEQQKIVVKTKNAYEVARNNFTKGWITK